MGAFERRKHYVGIALVVLAALPAMAVGGNIQEEAFIGWQGETYKPNDPLKAEVRIACRMALTRALA